MARRVRVATPEDAQAIRDIYAPFVEETAITFKTDLPPTATIADDIAATTETHPWLVVERIDDGSVEREIDDGISDGIDDGSDPKPGPEITDEPDASVIGYASASQLREAAAYRWTVEPSVYVADGHRGSGVGSTLYATLLRVLRVQGFVNVYAVTTLPNPASVALHERFDFEPVGTFPAAGHKHGEWHEIRWWYRRLRDPPADPDPPISFAELVGTTELQTLLNPADTAESVDSGDSTDEDGNS